MFGKSSGRPSVSGTGVYSSPGGVGTSTGSLFGFWPDEKSKPDANLFPATSLDELVADGRDALVAGLFSERVVIDLRARLKVEEGDALAADRREAPLRVPMHL